MSSITLPVRQRGRQSAQASARYQDQLEAFAAAILQIRSRLDFEVSSRGWCYVLEAEAGLLKSDFDQAQEIINECRKRGILPLDICAIDEARSFSNLEVIDDDTPEDYVESVRSSVHWMVDRYTPLSFWDGQAFFVQMVVEKIDLKSLFASICGRYCIPLANAKGWSDLHLRADMMRRFQEHEREGRQGVLLYCGDHDPAGLRISASLRANMAELSGAIGGWSPERIIVDRFGLNSDFIGQHNLSWIDNLKTGSGKDLADPRHKDHKQPYVQNYLREFGARKVEANALVTRPEAGRALCKKAVCQYIDADADTHYSERLEPFRAEARRIFEGGAA
ncbi:hypothetical protein CKO42_15520 [Lamprobacter modestohalophilus]|uniref:DUF2399 domain-containing protein n=1 Tax=Lamprobacter modestohalophilus TaxID=1064514 RepID=A0A9X0WAJ4_9GAMM|nr:hypothetical protein [Lamprobacter modestohalophilus]MBK1619826.1 hypothetical protein [Lamprobacter modestohalophilus]